MFNRNAINDLKKWTDSPDRKPLILRGARQVGKTSLVNLFSKNFDNYIYLNLEIPSEAKLFQRELSISDLFQSILLNKNISIKGKTLLFIDEIQNSPEAVNSLRYFYEELPELYVIGAGSLLEVMMEMKNISFPVGRVDMLFLYPCNFIEFLKAGDYNQALEIYNKIPIPDFALPELFKLFHEYALIGGMPEIVSKYNKSKKVTELNNTYQSLLISYLDDVSKYSRNNSLGNIIRHCIKVSPFEAGKRITFAGFGNSNYRSREVGEALRTIERAMLIYLLYPSTSLEIPIIPDLKKKPRLQFIDTGLLNFFADLQSHFFSHDNLNSFYRGLIAEHIVGQELIVLEKNNLKKQCFWVRESNQSNAEVDFIIQHKNLIIPIEVKSGKTGTLRSLHQFINNAESNFAIRLYYGKVELSENKTPEGKSYKLLNLPYFLAGKIHDYIDFFIDL